VAVFVKVAEKSSPPSDSNGRHAARRRSMRHMVAEEKGRAGKRPARPRYVHGGDDDDVVIYFESEYL
jgi:hypothetical protein